MSDQKPRTEAEILADWRALRGEFAAATRDFDEGWQERSARLAEREADLLEEAGDLDEVPREITQFLIGYAASAKREHARDVRRQS